MKRISRSVAALLAGVLLLLTLTSCAASRPVYASPRATKAVATVGDVEILYEELYFITMNYIGELKLTYGENALEDEAHRAELERFVWENLRSRDAALISLGREYGLDVFEGTIANNVDVELEQMLENQFAGDRGAYIENLTKMHLTDHYMRQYLAVSNHLANAIVLEMLKRGELPAFNADALTRTVHVFIDKANTTYTAEEHRAHAQQLQAEIAAGATPEARYAAMVAAIGGKYNNDVGDVLGHGYYFTSGEMEVAYEAAVPSADFGVSDVVETEKGYYIIMRLPKDEEYVADHFETLKNQSYFVVLNKKVDEKLNGMTLQKTKLGEGLVLADLTSIDVEGGSKMIVAVAIVGGVLLAGGVVFLTVRICRKKRKK